MTVSRIEISPDGPSLSRFVMGYWRLMDWGMDDAALMDFIEQGLELGITSIDHADIYGDYQVERRFGECLRQRPDLASRLEIVTKCGIGLLSPARPAHRVKHYDSSREHILASVDRSLSNLGVDAIDLLLIHRPDPLMNADEVAEAFIALHTAGKVKHFGVSNHSPAQFELLQSRLDLPLVTNQLEISLFNHGILSDGSLEHCQQYRVSPMAWSCLGGGRLFNGTDEQSQRLRGVLEHVGREIGGASVEQVVYAWVLMHPSRPLPIIGSGKIDRVRHAVEAEQVILNRQQWFVILQAARGYEVA